MSKISSSPSDHLEVDDLEENLARLGSYGNIPDVPVANSARSVFFVATVAAGDADGSSAGNALAGSATVISANATANVRDVFVFLAGAYDINGAAGGLTCSIDGVKIFGLGIALTSFVNSNGAATYVFNVTGDSVEIAGITSGEGTATVEGIYVTGDYARIHDNLLLGTMENGIHLAASSLSIIEDNYIHSCDADGIKITGICTDDILRGNYIVDVGDNGINLNGDNVDSHQIKGNTINGRGGTTDYAVQILLGDENEVSGNTMVELGTWPNLDSGSNNGWVNNYADVATSSFAREIVDGIGEITADFTNIDLWTSGLFEVTLSTRVATDGTVWTFNLYEKTNTSNFEIVDVDTYTVATDVGASRVRGAFEGGADKMQVGHITSVAVGGSRTINLKVRCIGQ